MASEGENRFRFGQCKVPRDRRFPTPPPRHRTGLAVLPMHEIVSRHQTRAFRGFHFHVSSGGPASCAVQNEHRHKSRTHKSKAAKEQETAGMEIQRMLHPVKNIHRSLHKYLSHFLMHAIRDATHVAFYITYTCDRENVVDFSCPRT